MCSLSVEQSQQQPGERGDLIADTTDPLGMPAASRPLPLLRPEGQLAQCCRDQHRMFTNCSRRSLWVPIHTRNPLYMEINWFVFVYLFAQQSTHSYWQCTRDSPSHSHKQRRWVTVLEKFTIINDLISCPRPYSPLLPAFSSIKAKKNKMLMCPTSLPTQDRGWHSIPSSGRISRVWFPLKPNKRLWPFDLSLLLLWDTDKWPEVQHLSRDLDMIITRKWGC